MSLWNDVFERRSSFNTLLEVIKLARRESSGDVTAAEALTLTAVYRAATIISGTVASLPLKAIRPDDAPKAPGTEIKMRPYDLLSKPNSVMTGFELREIQTAHLVLWGNSYTLKIYDASGRIKELWPISPAAVTPRLKGDQKVFEYRPHQGQNLNLTTRDIMHIPGFGYDGIKGLSPIGLARENITEQILARKYAGGVYRSGAIAAGLIKTPMKLKKEQADEIKQRWKDSIGGIENAGDIGVLDRGFEFEKMSIDPRDLQFLETRQFGVVEIARLYGVPPHLLMDVERSTSWGTGIEEQTLGFITYTLQPSYLTRIEKRYTTEILAGNLFAEFKIDGLLRSRARDRADVYTRALSPFTGWMTRAEVRELENLPPEDEEDLEEDEPVEDEPVEDEPEDEEPIDGLDDPDPDDIPGVREAKICSFTRCQKSAPRGKDTCLYHRHIGGPLRG